MEKQISKLIKKSLKKTVLVLVAFNILFALFCSFTPKHFHGYTSSAGVLIPAFINMALLSAVGLYALRLIKNKIHIAIVFFIGFMHILISLFAGFLLTVFIAFITPSAYRAIKDAVYENRQNRLRLAEQEKQEELIARQERERAEFETNFEKIDYIEGFMKVRVEQADVYDMPPDICNPYDDEELTINCANYEGDRWTFSDLKMAELSKGAVVKPMYRKTDSNGKNWIAVYINSDFDFQQGEERMYMEENALEPFKNSDEHYDHYFNDYSSDIENWKKDVVLRFYEFDKKLWNKK